MRKKKFH